jgi:hypothetical protein
LLGQACRIAVFLWSLGNTQRTVFHALDAVARERSLGTSRCVNLEYRIVPIAGDKTHPAIGNGLC